MKNTAPNFGRTEANSQKPATSLNQVGQLAIAVATFVLVAAGIGLVAKHWLTGWIAVDGMAGVGYVYVAFGLLELGLLELSQDEYSPDDSDTMIG